MLTLKEKVRLRFILPLLLISVVSLGQKASSIAVPGTKVSLIPPNGFIQAVNFSGFQNEEIGASIIVIEFPVSTREILNSFTPEVLAKQGMKFSKKEEIQHQNAPALLLYVTQEVYGKTYQKQVLVFGDSTKSVMVNGLYPIDYPSIGSEIHKSLLSSSLNKNQNENFEEAAKFRIDTKGTDFKVASFLAGGLTYTKDGKLPTSSPDDASIMIINSFGKNIIGDKKEYSIKKLKSLPEHTTVHTDKISPVTIDGMEGYEIITDRIDKSSKKEIIYFVMLFEGTGEYYIIHASAIDNYKLNLDDFKKIAKTFKLKL
ncbi:hypothetical protein TH61_00810 [Rufibacter sp. DG15C]|uniref:hypothetical protein n=1 Tax=Rufibacter sp. DG15C TaxID=1379909 RepID=UPI00078E3D2D|nr:hypothetical protein [Rufibacter sp. DG15C]AMM50011.1 hypothetical protein TH61_00810 [Rufibacter sp. DG15C]